MGNNICTEHKKLNSYLKAYNLVKLLGFKTSHNGVTFIYLAILIIMSTNKDLLIIEDVYSAISKQLGNVNKSQIRRSIQYSIDSRNKRKSEKNFERVFGYKYDQNIFTNKTFIEEITRLFN